MTPETIWSSFVTFVLFLQTNKKTGTETVPALPTPVGPASGSNIKTENNESGGESSSRSVSRENSLTKSENREKDKDTPDRKARKERDRESKEKSRERSSKVFCIYLILKFKLIVN